MKLAIIICGPYYIYHFYRLGESLKKKGVKVSYVLENPYEIYKAGYEKTFPYEDTYFLSDFRAQAKQKDIESIDWNVLYSSYDRISTYNFRVSTEDMELLVKASYILWDHLFKEEKIDGVIYENVSNTLSYVAFLKSKQYRKPYIGIMGATWTPDLQLIFTSDLYGKNETEANYNHFLKFPTEKLRSDCQDLYTAISSPRVEPYYMENNPNAVKYPLINHYVKKKNILWRYINYYLNEKQKIKNSYIIKNPFSVAFCILKREIKRRFMVKYLTPRVISNIDDKDKFLIYSMHFHPESTTSINAWNYTDEYPIIKNIAFSLPDGYHLYIKPHPNGFGYEGKSFYESLAKIPRVKIVSYSLKSKELIRRSKGVVILGGTMGLEALMIKKPVFLFGETFYQAHPFCNKMENTLDLPEQFKKYLTKKYDDKLFDHYNLALLKELSSRSFPGTVELSESYNKESIDNCVDKIMQIFDKQISKTKIPTFWYPSYLDPRKKTEQNHSLT